ncbi:MAG: B12-binding domain-containing radical SAM protein [Thermoprotei archaeon]|jgi:radical SAM superfamily enzyme YgiQ (UPF0313 family)
MDKSKVKFDVILTTDRSMMSNHHGKEFLGFMTTGPALGMPEALWMWIAAPKIKVDKIGRPLEAPYGMRKIEAVLIDNGINAAIIDPDYLKYYLNDAKVLMLSHHDYFALGPPSSEWWFITGKEPVNAKSFKKLIEKPEIKQAKKRGLKIIAGGPAAWQWLFRTDSWKEYGIDTVFDGEGEKIIPNLVLKALNNEELPAYVYVGPEDSPEIEEIPVIKAPSVNGLVEIMRGCPRHCSFCSVTLRNLRMIPLETIEKEIMINVSHGIKGGILHSEDVLLYGAHGIIPREEPLIKLHTMAIRYYRGLAWSHIALATLLSAQRNGRIIDKIMDIIINNTGQKFIGVETGIETGSPRLASKIMPAKAAPFKVDIWPDLVVEAFSIMHEHNILPAATLILGLPGETPDDVIKTAELIERLKPYQSLIVPMFFVPMGILKDKDWFRKVHLSTEHIEVLKLTLKHSLYWSQKIMNKYLDKPHELPLRLALNSFMKYVEWKTKKFINTIEEKPTTTITPAIQTIQQ